MNKSEVWNKVKGYEFSHEVSSFGNVRSVDRFYTQKDGKIYFKKGQILSNVLNKKRGYYYVNIKFEGKNKCYAVHRLVAENFIGVIDKNLVVDHIDNNKLNNKISNLQLLSQRDNLNKGKETIGVCWHKDMCKWMAYAYVNKKTKHLGYFNCKIEAFETYKNFVNENI